MSKKIVGLLFTILCLTSIVGIFSQKNIVASEKETRQKITFWHAMGGDLKIALEDIVNDYNKSQDKYEVIPNYQGQYAENLAKFQSVAGTSVAPNLLQVQEIGSKTMINNKRYIPVSKMAERDNFDLSIIEDQIAAYYSVDGKLQSSPFNSSTPVLYYNKEVLKQVGYDSFPATYEEIKDAGRKMKEKGISTKGFSLQVYGWLFEELLANQDILLLNQENGTTGMPTEVLFNNKETREMMQWIVDMIKEGTFVNYGTSDNDMTAGFLNGDVSMILASSASATQILSSAKFDVGIGYLPYPENGERTGVAIGGASVWTMKDKPEKEIAGSWDFLKYVMKPDVQAKWSLATGYFPINKESYKEKSLIDAYAKNTELEQPSKQLHSTKNVPATQGAKTTIITESRKIIEAGMEKIYNGGDIDSTLNQVSKDINQALTQANRVNK
ncbi:hypothetical protein BG262_04300 [Floricoccus penangensis]|uniref:Glycerol-3-phosphate ABC transporter substrate-binding protein n=1 Tax=Floricoccus penangensis TaxID=1859475 RepID=A0A9Q5JFS6_9LACT|nr:ABC transporter substrate-binding protein [Floricoccus penangensis]OFI46244.1 hypothetical protein BG262_04300 [Floricoccus penangensis]